MYIHIIIKADSLEQCMEYILEKSLIVDGAKKISIEDYWKDPGYYSINFELDNFDELIFDNITSIIPKGFGQMSIKKHDDSLDIYGTNQLYQLEEKNK